MRQNTVADRVLVEGIGVHSGKPARALIHPAEPGSGITFLRTQLASGHERVIEARYTSVKSTELCTVLGDDAAEVSTVEHLLSAFAGLGIDNATVEIDGPEMPILDGSARLFVEAIDQVGLFAQGASRRVIEVVKPVRVQIGQSVAELLPGGAGFAVDVEIRFDTPLIGTQRRAFEVTPARYRREIASAHTFGFMRDVQRLWKAGLALGASLENTVALGEDRIVNPEGLRYADEFVRHKILDAIGDLALAGAALKGVYRAVCPGHRLNIAVLEALFTDRAAYRVVDAPRRRERGHAEIAVPLAAFGPDVN